LRFYQNIYSFYLIYKYLFLDLRLIQFLLKMEAIDYTRHYQNWHADTLEHIARMTSFYRSHILHHFPKQKDIALLDIGCGMGFLLLALKSEGYSNIKGIDVDKGQVESCQKKGLVVELVEDTIAYLNQNQGKFDVISAFDVLEHIPSEVQISFARAVKEALKPEGVFIATVPNANSYLASRNRYIDYTHYVLFTEISLDFVLYNAGYKKIDIQGMDFVHFSLSPFRFLHWLLFKTARFSRRINFIAELGIQQGRSVPLSFNLIVKASR